MRLIRWLIYEGCYANEGGERTEGHVLAKTVDECSGLASSWSLVPKIGRLCA